MSLSRFFVVEATSTLDVVPSRIEMQDSLATIIVCFNGLPWLRHALHHLIAAGEANPAAGSAPVIVVDNVSTDGSSDVTRSEFPSAQLIQCERNLGFGGGANVGLKAVDSSIVVLLNPDVVVRPGSIAALLSAFRGDHEIAIAGGKLLYPDGKTIQHAGGKISYPLALADHHGYGEEDQGQYDEPRDVDYVTGALFAVRRSTVELLGGFDEGFFPAYFEEADLCYRARQAGFRVRYVPSAVAIHHESVTTGKATRQYYHFYHRNRIRFVLKHWTDDQLARDFFPAEAERLRALTSEVEVDALAEAYADNLAVIQDRATFFARPERVARIETNPLRLRLIETLANRARGRFDTRPRIEVANPPMTDPVIPDHTTDLLRARARVAEPDFTSSAPGFGPALVRLRRAWNWMSTKWYVRPMLAQQNAFNETLVDALVDSSTRLHDRVASVAMKLDTWEGTVVETERATIGVTRDLAQIENRLAGLEARLERIETLLQTLVTTQSPPSEPR